MRATLGRVAVVLILSIGATGCQSGGSGLAFWKKPASNSTAPEAPKFGQTAGPVLPSQGQNPANSLTSTPGSVWGPGNPSGVVSPVAGTAGYPAAGYPATSTAYQGAGYPTTPYEQAKVGRNVVSPSTTAWNGAATAPVAATGYGQAPAANAAYGSPAGAAAAPAYNVGNATSQGGITTSGFANHGYSAANAGAQGSQPAFSGSPASPATAGQPQNGLYNPAYDGGTPNRYASGATIPAMAPTTSADAYAGAVQPASAPQNYRVADARGTTSAAAGGGGAAANNAVVGDRYSNSNSWSTPAAGDRYAQPAGDYRTAPTGSDLGNTGYPAASANPLGNTGYNPPDAYSTGTPTNAAAPGQPVRNDPGYRPAGTGNYAPPTGGWSSPGASGAQQEPRAQATGVVPASYQSTDLGGARLKSATPVATSAAEPNGETYGAYQGSSPSSEPAYGAPNPATLPTNSTPSRW